MCIIVFSGLKAGAIELDHEPQKKATGFWSGGFIILK